MNLQVQREADCTKDYRLRRINPRAFLHKMTISNGRIIAVFQEVCFSALFVWAAVNLLEAPAQHSTGVGRALLLRTLLFAQAFLAVAQELPALRGGCAVTQEVLAGMWL